MQVAVESLNKLQRRMTVKVAPEQVDDQVNVRLKEHARTAKLKGFRPGKAPFDVIKRQYGDAIRQEVIGEVIKKSFYDALQEKQLNIVGMPHIEPKQIAPGQELIYEATFEVLPEIKLNDLTGVKLEKLQANVNDQDLEKVLQKLQEQHMEWLEVERASKKGDRLLVDFAGTINNEPIQGGSAQKVNIVLGSNTMIPGFEDNLIGTQPKQDLEINVNFPAEYGHKDLAGKPAKFQITVHKVEEPRLPMLDDAFAKKLDVEGGIENLRSEVRKSMEREVEQRTKDHLKQQVLEQLLARNPVEIPESLVDAEIQAMQEQLQQRLGLKPDKKGSFPELPREHFVEQARHRVSIGLLLSEFIKQQHMHADANRVRRKIEEVAAGFDQPSQVVQYYYQNKSMLNQIESFVLEEQAIEKLLEQAQVEEKSVSYDEAINPKQKGE